MKALVFFTFLFNTYAGGVDEIDLKKHPVQENILNKNKQVLLVNNTKDKKIELKKDFDHSHAAWTKLLSKHVTMGKGNKSSRVDYKGFDQKGLDKYLKSLSSVYRGEFGKWSRKQQLAFYINAYNAFTIKLILNHYPVKSIKKISFFSPWKKEFFKLFDESYYLDKIEHKRVRESGKYKDARIHFAFNCASVGCPALLNKAWQASTLDEQFDEAARNFLSDRSRNRVNIKKGAVEVSNIFKWYGKDFNGNKMGYASLRDFFAKYADALGDNPDEISFLKNKGYSIKYTGYDWDLNK